jgi:Zn-dependent protease with chaperone function
LASALGGREAKSLSGVGAVLLLRRVSLVSGFERKSIFQFWLILLLGVFAGSLQGQSLGTPGAILPRSPHDFANLLEMQQPPQPEVSQVAQPIAGGKPVKIATKYDVTKIGERGTGSGVNFYSIEQEQALGKQLSQEVEAVCKVLNDKVVNDYVNTLGQRLVRYSDAKIPFTIKVLDDDQVNAFALPGGYLYVNSGLILAAQTEAELAGVMAHEIAHVAARHGTKGATRTQIWNLASIPLVFVGGPIGMAIREISQIAVPMTFLKFSRGFEREADLLGVEYEYAAGYDPAAFVDFFDRMNNERKKPNFMARAFATHPMNKDRMERAQKEIDTMLPPHDQYVVTTSEFVEMQSHLQQIKGEKPHLETGPRGNKPVLHRHDSENSTPTSEAPGPTDDSGPKLQRR